MILAALDIGSRRLGDPDRSSQEGQGKDDGNASEISHNNGLIT
jgi:hypothetical protein